MRNVVGVVTRQPLCSHTCPRPHHLGHCTYITGTTNNPGQPSRQTTGSVRIYRTITIHNQPVQGGTGIRQDEQPQWLFLRPQKSLSFNHPVFTLVIERYSITTFKKQGTNQKDKAKHDKTKVLGTILPRRKQNLFGKFKK